MNFEKDYNAGVFFIFLSIQQMLRSEISTNPTRQDTSMLDNHVFYICKCISNYLF